MTNITGWILVAFVLYLLMMIVIGAIYSRKSSNTEEYFLGGRNLGGFVAALSAQASDMSGWLLMGLPGAIFIWGMNGGDGWCAVGLLIGTILNWLIVASRLRKYTIVANNSVTLPMFFENRFNDKKRFLMLVSSIIIVIFFAVYCASALAAGGKLFQSIFGVDYKIALTLGALVILIYTFLGGFMAVCVTDFIQGTLMLVALLAVPIIACFCMKSDNISLENGFENSDAAYVAEITEFADEYMPELLKDESLAADPNALRDALVAAENEEKLVLPEDVKIPAGAALAKNDGFINMFSGVGIIGMISGLAWGLGYFGMPHILVRFMAVKSEKEMKKSKGVAIAWVTISLFMACVIGIVGRAYMNFRTMREAGSEKIFIEMIKKVFTEEMNTPIIAGLFLCGILAAIMSTADSQLLVSASAVAEDIFKGVIKKDADDKTVMAISRGTIVIIAIIAYLIAWNPDSSVMTLVSDAWAGLGSAFGPLVLMSLFWKRTNLPGAVAGLVSGALTVIIWDYIPCMAGATIGSATGLYSLAVGFPVSLVMIIIVSLVTKAPSKEIQDQFDSVKNVAD